MQIQTITLEAKTVSDLSGVATQLLRNYGNYRIFAFYGQMGVGKTTFIKEICRQLNCPDAVNSPTYALVNEYWANEPVYHLDLYRLKTYEEALDIGIIDYLNSSCYCFIEWPEIIEPLFDKTTVSVHLSLTKTNSRQITIQAP